MITRITLIRKNDGALLIEMMIAMSILAIVTLSTTSVVINSSLGTHSNDLGAQFNTDTSLVQGLLNNSASCTAGFLGENIAALLSPLGSGKAINLSTIPVNGNPLITAQGTTPGLQYPVVDISSVLEQISTTSYLLNVHLQAQKIGNNRTILPGNNLYTKDFPMCVTLNSDLATIKSCGPTDCSSTTITGVTVGLTHACVVTNTGVKCWGSDVTNFTGDANIVVGPNYPGDFDTLGNEPSPPATTPIPATPIAVDNLSTSTSVLTSPAYNQFGSPTYQEIKAGGTHTCIQTPNGAGMECWGDQQSGQLGTGTNAFAESGADPSPVDLPTGLTVVDFATANDSTCAVLSNEQVYCWGCNEHGELGRGTTPQVPPTGPNCGGSALFPPGPGGVNANTPTLPVEIPGGGPLTGVQMVGGGIGFFCAISNHNLTFSCWGECDNGVDMNSDISNPSNSPTCGDDTTPGDNTTGDAHAYVRNSLFPSTVTSFLSVQGGGYHACVLTAPGNQLYCWGDNTYGELGNPAGGGYAPTLAIGGTVVSSFALGGYDTCAMINGTLNCWGDNTYGQLGQGNVDYPNPSYHPNPLPVSLPGRVTAYAVGRFSVCAVVNSNSVYCWGANGYWAQETPTPPPIVFDETHPFFNLGNNNPAPSGVPTLVQGL